MSNRMQQIPILSIVIPVYNELLTWKEALEMVEQVDLPGLGKQIVLVDDCSMDGTREQLERFAQSHPDRGLPHRSGRVTYKVVFHEHNRGKGAAVRTGFAAAGGDIVIVQDADLEYDPRDYPQLVAPILRDQADVVYGSRFRRGRPPRGYLSNYLANRLLTLLSNLTTGLRLTDMETCYKVFRSDVLKRIHLQQDRFGFEPEVTAKLALLGLRICEVPIRYTGRTHAEGKKIGWFDGLEAVWCIAKYAFLPRLPSR